MQWLTIKKLMNNWIEATIITGKFNGETVLIPHIPLITDNTPFQFKRLQFPIRLAYAMTINKAQGVWTKFRTAVLFEWSTVRRVLQSRQTIITYHLHNRWKIQKYCLSKSITITNLNHKLKET